MPGESAKNHVSLVPKANSMRRNTARSILANRAAFSSMIGKSSLRFSAFVALLLATWFASDANAQAGFTGSEKGRQTVRAKLAIIRLDNFQVSNLPLSEVLKNLREESKKRDPEKRGVNFLLNPNRDDALPAATQTSPAPATEPVDISSLQINIAPMADITLEQALKAIVKVAGPPRLKYAVEDYAVVFYPSAEAIPLYVRIYKLDPNFFQQGLHSVAGVPFASVTVRAGTGGGGTAGGGGTSGQGGQNQNGSQVAVPRVQVAPTTQGGAGGTGGASGQGGIPNVSRTNSMDSVQVSVRSFLQGLGVDMTPPKSAVFNDRTGTLVIRATQGDLDLIDSALGR
jgi:hypothetical protein